MALTQADAGLLSPTNAQYTAFKNRIINGSCVVGQRGAVSGVNNATTYGGCDRIPVSISGFSTYSGNIAQAGSVGSGASVSGYVQQVGAVTTTGSGTIGFNQRIEAINVADLNGSAITVSVLLYQDTGSTLSPTINVYKPTALDNWTSSTFINGVSVSLPSGVRTKFTFTTTLGASDANNGLAVVINIPVGAVTGKYFQLGDLQLEKGSTATSFDYRPYGTELALCERYYQSGRFHYFAAGQGSGDACFTFPVNFRTNPTSYQIYDLAGTAGQYTDASGNGQTYSVNASGVYDKQWVVQTILARTTAWVSFTWVASAEL